MGEKYEYGTILAKDVEDLVEWMNEEAGDGWCVRHVFEQGEYEAEGVTYGFSAIMEREKMSSEQ